MYSRVGIWFFFSSRRPHTGSLCDWSSDVCSSDLADTYAHSPEERAQIRFLDKHFPERRQRKRAAGIGRASGREGGKISGVAVSLKKKKRNTGGVCVVCSSETWCTDVVVERYCQRC